MRSRNVKPHLHQTSWTTDFHIILKKKKKKKKKKFEKQRFMFVSIQVNIFVHVFVCFDDRW